MAANPAGLVVCAVLRGEEIKSGVWRLDLGELRWKRMASLTLSRAGHACCAVRGGVAVLGRYVEAEEDEESVDGYKNIASVEILGHDSQADMPPLSCGPISHHVAVMIDESESEQG